MNHFLKIQTKIAEANPVESVCQCLGSAVPFLDASNNVCPCESGMQDASERQNLRERFRCEYFPLEVQMQGSEEGRERQEKLGRRASVGRAARPCGFHFGTYSTRHCSRAAASMRRELSKKGNKDSSVQFSSASY